MIAYLALGFSILALVGVIVCLSQKRTKVVYRGPIYEYTEDGIIFYDKEGKKILIRSTL